MKDILYYLTSLCGGQEFGDVHWVHGDDESRNWCYTCCKAKARHLRRHGDRNMRKEYRIDGGYSTSFEDGPTFCEGCGNLLHYSLTRSGLEEELDHFLEYKIPEKIDPVTAYELATIFEAAEYEEDGDIARDVRCLAEQIRQARGRES